MLPLIPFPNSVTIRGTTYPAQVTSSGVVVEASTPVEYGDEVVSDGQTQEVVGIERLVGGLKRIRVGSAGITMR